ncbi:MAG: DnaJ family molecular chaperone [Hyphomicrobiaceae bacterium]
MFSNGEVYRDLEPCVVSVTLTTGAIHGGTIQKPRSKSLHDYLNSEGNFVEMELFTGTIVQIAKSSISICEQRDVPKADQLNMMVRRAERYHPYGTLGLKADTTKEETREAYRGLMRLYHGDRYATVELPPEVVHYLDDMAKRVNLAYRDIMTILTEAENATKASQRTSAGTASTRKSS